MAKLTQAQIREKAEEYAGLARRIGELNAKYDEETAAIMVKHVRQMDRLAEKQSEELLPFAKKYSVDKLNEQAAALYDEIIAWLQSQKKPVTIETENAIAKLLKGSRPGDRQVDPEKFIDICTRRGVTGFWKAVRIVLKFAEPMLGKNDLEEISTKADVPFEEASLELK